MHMTWQRFFCRIRFWNLQLENTGPPVGGESPYTLEKQREYASIDIVTNLLQGPRSPERKKRRKI